MSYFFTFIIAALPLFGFSQNYVQTVRGNVTDTDAKTSLIGVKVELIYGDSLKRIMTDLDGNFKFNNIPIGKHFIKLSYIGYEPSTIPNIVVNSGKELVLNLELSESITNLKGAVVNGTKSSEANNEMATLSARSFSAEETGRYAASAFDPARMAQNYAGVSTGGGDDLSNDIVVRGNSSKGILWRLEGIEIPNPNHFGGLGNSGGAISMLSSSTLARSDFFTGAFPSEYGNAMSGVFDLSLRNGNNEKREYALMVGLLGIEAAAEGPFKKGKEASYLINYRYSTLSALSAIGLNPVGDILPAYQDLSFKINLPTKNFGRFAFFGLGGKNIASYSPEIDSINWSDNYGFTEQQTVGTVGLSHFFFPSAKTYIKTIAVLSSDLYSDNAFYLDSIQNFNEHFTDTTAFENNTARVSVTINHKINSKHTVRAGAIFSNMIYRFDAQEEDDETLQWINYLSAGGQTEMLQSYAHWKYRIHEDWTLNAGAHYTYFGLNGNTALDPRFALQWNASAKTSFGLSLGKHSKPEHISFYLTDITNQGSSKTTPNKNLEINKALHAVFAWTQKMQNSFKLTSEVYYQHLYDIPISATQSNNLSMLNATDIWDIFNAGAQQLNNDGTGTNYGLDLTLEKSFDTDYYIMLSGSLYNSTYEGSDGKTYNTSFNGNYQANIIGGKEIAVGKQKKNTFSFNGKYVISGGRRYTPMDIDASIAANKYIFHEDRAYASIHGPYMRLDIGVKYKINKKKSTHSIMLDIQNVTNRENIFFSYYNLELREQVTSTQTGFFPFLNYRIEF